MNAGYNLPIILDRVMEDLMRRRKLALQAVETNNEQKPLTVPTQRVLWEIIPEASCLWPESGSPLSE